MYLCSCQYDTLCGKNRKLSLGATNFKSVRYDEIITESLGLSKKETVFSELNQKTGEQRLDELLDLFERVVKHEYLEAKKLGDIPEDMQGWVVYKEDWEKEYGLKRAFNKHLKTGHGMTFSEFDKCLHWCLGFFDSEESRLQFFLDVGSLLFYHTLECKEFGSYPFSRPLDELLESIIKERVDEAVANALRTYKWQQRQEEIGK